jgi:hypothetical protein
VVLIFFCANAQQQPYVLAGAAQQAANAEAGLLAVHSYAFTCDL